MKNYSFLLFVHLSIISFSFNAMERSCEPNSPTKRSYDIELPNIENLSVQSPKKKPCIVRSITRTEWKEQQSPNSRLPLLCPIEHTNMISVEVEPVVHAVYTDNIEKLQQLFETTKPDLLAIIPGILSSNEEGTLLDIAADRGSYRCLAYFVTILTAHKRNLTLQECAVRALENKQDAKCCLDEWEIEQYTNTLSMHVIYHIEPKLRKLFKISQSRALRIARAHKDGRCEVMLKQNIAHL